MEWIEFIHVRAFSEDSKAQALQMAHELSLTKMPGSVDAINLWFRLDVQTDISILLYRTGDEAQRSHSSLGLQLAENFSQFGWVSHSVWGASKVIAP